MTTQTLTLTGRTCSVDGCDRSGKLTRAMCIKHYRNWLDQTPPSERGLPPRFRREFWDLVDKTESCWLWTGTVNVSGYGTWSDVHKTGTRGLAHRISLAAVCPPASDELLACHRCNVPACVRPDHLYWGTAADNARDVAAAGGPWNKGLQQSHCRRGHELVGENLKIVGAEQRRRCRTCENKRAKLKMRALSVKRRAEREASNGAA